MKSLIISSVSFPDEIGYLDKYTIADSLGNVMRHDVCSACPNPTQPKTGKAWQDVYGWLAPIRCIAQCVDHGAKRKHIVLNNGWFLPARLPNANHGGLPIINEALMHCGDSETWRGSAACCTVPPSGWQSFIDCFSVGELISFAIIDCPEMRVKV